MKISNIAISNVKGNLYRYVMYMLSNAFAVAVFFIFSNFIMNPALDPSNASPIAAMNSGILEILTVCQYIIVLFTIGFVGYSISIFLKSRGSEFGLLSLYGMTKRQIRKYVFVESSFISLLSIIIGIVGGGIFSKLFFITMEYFLAVTIPFNISVKAIGLTIVLFFILFTVVNLINLLSIKNKQIVEQIKISKVPKELPKFSRIKAFLGVLLLVTGYTIAWSVSPNMIFMAMMPVIFITIAGTYFIFTQFSIYIANKVLRNKNILYKKTNLVAYSQMIFKLKDTAKVLYLAAILGAITFTATETMYSFYEQVPNLTGANTFQDIAIVQKGNSLDDNIDDILSLGKIDIKNKTEIDALELKIDKFNGSKNSSRVLFMSNSQYNQLMEDIGQEKLNVEKDNFIYLSPYGTLVSAEENFKIYKEETLNIKLESFEKTYKYQQEFSGNTMALSNLRYFDAVLLNDEDFNDLYKTANKDMLVKYTGIYTEKTSEKDEYEKTVKIVEALEEKYEGEEVSIFSKSVLLYSSRKAFGLTMFIGFFLAFLFMIATGSIIYFKLFSEIKQDAIEYDILRKIGMTNKEVNKIITKQMAIIFFLPFIMGVSHAMFALKALSNLFQTNLFANGLVVAIGYFIVEMIYFIIIRSMYIKKINNKEYLN